MATAKPETLAIHESPAVLWKRCAKNYRARWMDVRAKWLAAWNENVELKRRRRRRAGQAAANTAAADPSVGGSKA